MANEMKLSSRWYKTVDTQSLIELSHYAKERADIALDSIEEVFWNLKMQAIHEELILRQAWQDQLEL